ncbi:MAG: flavodoxin family protein [Marinoscillum sp.]
MDKPDFSKLKATYINCTLKKSPEKSHTQGLMDLSINIMKNEGVEVDVIRLIDHVVASGVFPDMTENGWVTDEWPSLFERIINSDILVIGTPIWLGEKSSETQKLIERLYAMSAELNQKGQYLYYGKVGGCLITGNEDGVKHCAMGILYSLQHIGYSIPPQADAGWIGEVGPGPSYLDEAANSADNDFTNQNTTFMTYNLLHLSKTLKDQRGYSSYGNSSKAWNEGERWGFEKRQ